MISNKQYAAKAEELLNYAENNNIPYVAGGMTLNGMDCQGLCEYLLIECGVQDCNLAGSNAHYRNCSWVGTPEEAVEMFGSVPDGAWVFILEQNGAEPEKYKADGMGNASHMGVKVKDGVALHASSSRGKVARSNFNDKTVPNGGWNRVGLPPWVDYGIETGGEATMEDTVQDNTEDDVYGSIEEAQAALVKPSQNNYTKYVLVTSPNEYEVKLRELPKKGAIYKYTVPAGTFLVYKGEDGNYYKVSHNGSTRYIQKDFGKIVRVKA